MYGLSVDEERKLRRRANVLREWKRRRSIVGRPFWGKVAATSYWLTRRLLKLEGYALWRCLRDE